MSEPRFRFQSIFKNYFPKSLFPVFNMGAVILVTNFVKLPQSSFSFGSNPERQTQQMHHSPRLAFHNTLNNKSPCFT